MSGSHMIKIKRFHWIKLVRGKTKIFIREKGRDLTQSYDKSHYTNRNVKRAKSNTSVVDWWNENYTSLYFLVRLQFKRISI